MNYTTLLWDVDSDGIATVTLHRPDALNAFTLTMARELEHLFLTDAQDDAVRAVIITGSGRAFCAGMDLRAAGNVFGLDESLRPTLADMEERLTEDPFNHGVRDTGGRVALAIHELPKPVIAAINGAAVGIGATMTLAADIRMASVDARIGFVFGRLGIVPEACSSWFLPRLVGLQRALEWVWAADVISIDEALESGLIRSVHQSDELMSAALDLARSFVRERSPIAIGLAKQMLLRNCAAPHPLDAHKAESLAMFYTSIGDGKEGVAAFREHRSPHFTGRASGIPLIAKLD